MKFLLTVVIFAALLVEPNFASGQAFIYGNSGTFGTLPDTLISGQSLTKVATSNLKLPPGRVPFFMASTSDGTVFSGTFNTYGGNLMSSSCYMAIVCINTNSQVCYDESDGGYKNISTIYVKTGLGYKVPGNDTSICLTPSTSDVFRVTGADVTDIQTVVDEGGTERVAFISTSGSFGHANDYFPALGFVSKINGAWRLDSAKQYWPDQMNAASLVGKTVCPVLSSGLASCNGFSEMAFLPGSRRLAIGFYYGTGKIEPAQPNSPLGQALAIFDLNGVPLASYRFDAPGNRCTADPNDTVGIVGTRQVDVDPTGRVGAERIATTADASLPFPHPIQVLEYNDHDKSLKPVTNFVSTTSGSDPLADCAQQGQNANFDKFGNLVVGAYSSGKSTYHIYIKKKRSIETRCPFTAVNEDTHARGCLADLSVGEFTGLSGNDPRWGFSFHNTNTDFDRDSSVLARLTGAKLSLLDEFQVRRTPVFVSYRAAALDASKLPRTGHADSIVGWKGTLQRATKSFWAPLATNLELADPDCTLPPLLCNRYVNEKQPGWFIEFKYDEIMNAALRVRGVKSSARVIRKSSPRTFKMIFKTNDDPALDPASSGFWLFPAATAQAVYHADVINDGCGSAGCSYRVRFPQNDLQGLAEGDYRWSVVMKGSSTNDLAHAQGVISLSR
jgi:hypothetical protein